MELYMSLSEKIEMELKLEFDTKQMLKLQIEKEAKLGNNIAFKMKMKI